MHSIYNTNTEVEFQLQLGSNLWPAYPTQSLSEALLSLRITLGITNTNAGSEHVINIFSMADKRVFATDLDNILGAHVTCYNRRIGYLMTFRLHNAWDGSTDNTAPSHTHIVLHDGADLNNDGSESQVLA